jgi:hypothetical protein
LGSISFKHFLILSSLSEPTSCSRDHAPEVLHVVSVLSSYCLSPVPASLVIEQNMLVKCIGIDLDLLLGGDDDVGMLLLEAAIRYMLKFTEHVCARVHVGII